MLIGWSHHVIDWAALPLVGSRIPYLVHKINEHSREMVNALQVPTLLPASLLCRFIMVLASESECRGWFFSRSRTSTNPSANLYPYSLLSPQPPQIQSLWSCLGLGFLEHPHDVSSPSLHDLATACTTPAALIACVNAASRDAETKWKIIIISTD